MKNITESRITAYAIFTKNPKYPCGFSAFLSACAAEGIPNTVAYPLYTCFLERNLPDYSDLE